MSNIIPNFEVSSFPDQTTVTNKNTRRRLDDIKNEAAEAQALRAVNARAVADMERQKLDVIEFRIHGVYELATYATHRATILNDIIAAESHGNPRLEAIHRNYEEAAAVISGTLIYQYGTSR